MPRVLALILSVFLVAACSAVTPPRDVDAAARLAFDQLRKGQDAALMARGTDALKAADPATLDRIRATLPKGEPTSSRALFWTVNVGTGGHQATVDHEYVFADKVVMVSTALARPSGDVPWAVHGLHVAPVTQAAAEANTFGAEGKTAGQYAFLAAVIASPLLMIAAIVMVIRTPGLKRKWLWCLLSLVGAGSLTMNWTTGELAVQYLSVQIIGAGVMKNASVLAPWMLKMTVPFGAILAILRTRRRAPRTAPADS